MTMIEEQSFTCPVDGEVFEDGIVLSTNQMGTHTDFKPVVGGLFPFPFYVHACPKCGFAGYEEDFSTEYSEDFKDWVTSGLAAELQSGPLYGGIKYLLAARCAHKLGKPGREVADLYLRGAWCAQDEEAPELEARCREEAAKLFEEALESGEIEDKGRASVTYLVGELHRRLGSAETANDWFDKVAGEVVDSQEQGWLLKAAKMQKESPTDIFPEDLGQ
jgi:uncharacterized protein (DUF2225 family)